MSVVHPPFLPRSNIYLLGAKSPNFGPGDYLIYANSNVGLLVVVRNLFLYNVSNNAGDDAFIYAQQSFGFVNLVNGVVGSSGVNDTFSLLQAEVALHHNDELFFHVGTGTWGAAAYGYDTPEAVQAGT